MLKQLSFSTTAKTKEGNAKTDGGNAKTSLLKTPRNSKQILPEQS